MPNRVLRDGFVDSAAVSALSDWTHRVYSNLLVRCDDAGRFDGRLEILRSYLFPLGTNRRVEDFGKSVEELVGLGLVVRYEFRGRFYVQVTKWQRCGNATNSRYPWRDGSHRIQYVRRETRDGEKDFVSTSVTDGVPIPSEPHTNRVEGDSDTTTETETDTKTHDDDGPAGVGSSSGRESCVSLGMAREFAVGWVRDNASGFVGTGEAPFTKLVAQLGRERAVEEVRTLMLDSSIGNPFAVAWANHDPTRRGRNGSRAPPRENRQERKEREFLAAIGVKDPGRK
jgi:hypothetical protein